MSSLRTLDLFSGIGGFALAAEQVEGFTTNLLVEQNSYCQAVLSHRFPGIPIHDDIRTLTIESERYDLICGGSPCQDLSQANPNGDGLDGDRSGLWFHMLRLIQEGQPRFVIWENVGGSLHRGVRAVLGGLRMVGYAFDHPEIVSAAEIGAPHQRDRVFIVAYPAGALAGKDRLPESWSRQVSREVEAIAARGSRQSSQRAGVDDGVPGWLDGITYHGWWDDNPPPQTISIPAYSLPYRQHRHAALGNAVTPQQAAFPLRRVKYLSQFV